LQARVIIVSSSGVCSIWLRHDLETISLDAVVVFEATSGCDAGLMAALTNREVPFSRVNPRQAHEPWLCSQKPTGSMPTSLLRWGKDFHCHAPSLSDQHVRAWPNF
jgi:hypothetical protein